jgi:hypothetical protein
MKNFGRQGLASAGRQGLASAGRQGLSLIKMKNFGRQGLASAGRQGLTFKKLKILADADAPCRPTADGTRPFYPEPWFISFLNRFLLAKT